MSTTGQSFHESKSMRRKRDEVFENKRYSNMQWRFLRHTPPEIPHFPTSSQKNANSPEAQQRKFLYPGEPPAIFFPPPQVEADGSMKRTTSELFRMLELDQTRNSQQPGAGIPYLTVKRFSPRRPPMDPNVMDYLTGEAQKKEMIDRLVSEMEDLVASRPTSQAKERKDNVDPELFVPKRRESTINSILRYTLGSQHAQTIRGGMNSPDSVQSQSSGGERVELLPQRRLSHFEVEEEDDAENIGSTRGNSPVQHERNEDFRAEYDHENRRSSETETIEAIQNIRDRNPNQTQRIHWQKTSRVKFARDIPAILDQSSSEDSSRHNSTKTSKVSSPRPPSPRSSKRSSPPKPADTMSVAQRFGLSSPSNQQLHVARNIPKKTKATYGAWYVPKEEWWQQHQFHQRYIERDVDGLDFNQNVLNGTVSLALAGRSTTSREPSTRKTSTSPRNHTKVATGIDAISTRSALLHEEIPKSYIGKEYRTYILNKSMRLPPYLRENHEATS